jgi:hypothetical protein
MASRFTMVPTTDTPKPARRTNVKGKSSTNKSSGKQKIQAGPSGKMQKFTPVKPQKPGGSAVTNSGGGGYAKGK